MSEIKVNSTGEVKLFDSDNSNYVSIKSPATVASNVTLTLPSTDEEGHLTLQQQVVKDIFVIHLVELLQRHYHLVLPQEQS
jgi:hypothetical protein